MPYTLDWASVGSNGTYSLADGTDTVGVTVSTATNAMGQTASSMTNGSPAAAGLWVSGLTQSVTSTLNFDSPVSNFSFEIYDIDAQAFNPQTQAGGWADKLTILVTDANGNVKAVNFGDLTADPYHSNVGNVLSGTGSASPNVETSGAADSVPVTIAGPVSKIEFIFDHGDDYSRSGAFGIGNMSFSDSGLNYIVEGTSGDDLIDDLYSLDPEGDRIDANDNAAGNNDDVVLAGDGNDTVRSGLGNDSVDAGIGDDSVIGAEGDDTLIGGEGDDTLIGDFESDSSIGTRGDPVAGPGGNDSLVGGAGKDSIYGGSGDDTLEGGDGDDSLLGGHGDDLLFGGAGNDDLEGLYGDDTIYGGDGDDHVFGRDGADLIYGGDGNDSLIGSIGIDTLYGGLGNDILAGSQGSDLIYGGEGNDIVYIGVPAPGDIAYDNEGEVHLDEGDDWLDATDATLKFVAYGGDGNDLMGAGIGDDTLEGGTGDDTISGGAGNDSILGDAGDDELYGGDGDDFIAGGAEDDRLSGDAGDDTLHGDEGDDQFSLEDGFGDDIILGGETAESDGDTLDASGLTGDSVLDLTAGDAADPESGTLTSGSDVASFAEIENIVLGEGNDSVIGSTGDDEVTTGAGADTVDGGAGQDTFDLGADGDGDLVRFSDGDGADTILGFDAPITNPNGSFSGVDLLDVSELYSIPGQKVTVADVVVSDDGNGNAVLTFPNGESLTMDGISPTAASNPAYLVAMGIPDTGPDYIVEGTTGDDLIDDAYVLDPEGDRIDANDNAAGNNDDVVKAGTGNDTVLSAAGNDEVYGEKGDDSLDGGIGNDTLYGGVGNDTLLGQDGKDDLHGGTGDDVLYGGAGNDTLHADEGNDSIYGGDGNDSILGYEGNDYVEGGDGDDYINTRTSPGTGAPDQGYPGYYAADTDPSNDLDTVYGGIGDDTILTGDDDDLIYGGAGRDSIDAGFDDDTVYGGDDNDTIIGNEGNDYIDGGLGDDVIYGGLELGAPDLTMIPDDTDLLPANGLDTIHGGEGNDLIYGMDDADELHGDAGNDTLYGGIDNDSLYGGDGADTLYGDEGDDFLSTGTNTGPGEDAAYGGAGNDSITGGGTGVSALSGGDGDDTITGSLNGHTLAYGGDGNDSITGGDLNDQLFGDAGDDVIRGGDGADELNGDQGNDTLYGGAGADSLNGGDDRDLFFGGIGDIIDGGEGGDDFDVLNLSALGGAAGTNVIYGGGNNEAGTVEVLDGLGNVTGTFNFSNIESVVPCFTPGTLILTCRGEMAVEDLQEGDRVLTRDSGYQPIRWVGKRHLSRHDLAANPAFNPVRIRAGALGAGLPERDMTVSPQHRMLITGSRAEMLFGDNEVLVAALHLVNDRSVVRAWPQEVTYIHIMFDRHEIVRANGAWTESFQPGELTLGSMDSPQRAELLKLFPQLEQGMSYPSARISLKAYEAKVLMQQA